MKRETQITLETEELISIKGRRSFNEFCELCRTRVEMLRPESAAHLSGLTEREIFRLIEGRYILSKPKEFLFAGSHWESI
jgi:hypothetical protein